MISGKMNLFTHLALFGLFPISAHAATIFSANFENGTVGTAPTDFTAVNAPTNTIAQISNTYQATKGNTLLLADNSGGVGANNPSIAHTLSSTYAHYMFSYDYKWETGSSYIHRTELYGGTKKVDIRFDGGRLKLVNNSAPNDPALAQSELFTTFAGWSTTGFNNFSYEINDSTDTIIARINGVVALTYTYSTAFNLQANQFQIHVGYSSNSGDSAQFDNVTFVTIPEPSTGLISILALGLTTRRKR